MKVLRKICFVVSLVFLLVIILLLRCSNHSAPGSLFFVHPSNFKPQQSSQYGLIVVVHGWIEKGGDNWPEDMAAEIAKKVDSDLWLCSYFDWPEGADRINPTDAAKFARDTAGPRLADEIMKRCGDAKHIHLIGHSCGCWVINKAAEILAEKTSADLHLTFLDAYVPIGWPENQLGDIKAAEGRVCWAEHYFTRDYTVGFTEVTLTNAHNVDISTLDSGLKDHKFPWRWYYATIAGGYPKSVFSDSTEYEFIVDGIEYGFARSKEVSGEQAWLQSLTLLPGNEPVSFNP
ncbi:hypothetical protein ES703_121536 [subsurface metagenome]